VQLETILPGPVPEIKSMSVLEPPPKRQKLYYGIPEPQQPEKETVPNVVVQFVTDEEGRSIAPAVNLPADLAREALESLVNKLSKSVGVQPTPPGRS
jgi:ribosome assembly protein 4